MNLQDAITTLQEIAKRAGDRAESLVLSVATFGPGNIGGTPKSLVKSIEEGIDWDANSVILRAEADLTALTNEEKAEIRESVKKGQSWHAYQQYRANIEKIQKLEQEIKALKAAR
jgi:hypothetical protein